MANRTEHSVLIDRPERTHVRAALKVGQGGGNGGAPVLQVYRWQCRTTVMNVISSASPKAGRTHNPKAQDQSPIAITPTLTRFPIPTQPQTRP